MLRKGLVALVIGMLANSSLMADEGQSGTAAEQTAPRPVVTSTVPEQALLPVTSIAPETGPVQFQPQPLRPLHLVQQNAPAAGQQQLRTVAATPAIWAPAQHPATPPAPPQAAGYPQLGASLYPAPVAGIPAQMGGTAITNPALHPHELMYEHEYKALYAPFYYEVKGEWIVTPFGVWTQENWKLRGTEVNVKYRKRISPFALFRPPGR